MKKFIGKTDHYIIIKINGEKYCMIFGKKLTKNKKKTYPQK